MEYFLLKRDCNECKITFQKPKNYIRNKKDFKQYENLKENYKKNFKEFEEKDRKRIDKLLNVLPSDTAINLLKVRKENTVEIIPEKGDFNITDYNSNKKVNKKKKYKNIISLKIGRDIYLQILKNTSCIREKNLHKYNLKKLLMIYKYLENDGNFVFKIENYCNNESIELIYLCLCLFKEIVIFNGFYLCCREFEPIITEKNFEKLINKDFVVENKPKLKELESYLIKSIQFTNKIYELIIKLKLDELYEIFYLEYYKFISTNPDFVKDGCLNEVLVYLNKFFITELKKSFNTNSGKIQKLKAGIGPREGRFLQSILKSKNMKKCMEIGLAMGVSALNILSTIYKHGGTLVSIDPNQSGKWDNMGKKLIVNSGLGKYHKIIEDKSYNAMPELLKKEEGTYDFIFIDGWHTFDYTLIDFFYADKLLKIGGLIVVDDALHDNVKKTLKYLDTNYCDFYKKIESPPTFGAYKKIQEDTRNWKFHRNF